jgi:hypothetical protein
MIAKVFQITFMPARISGLPRLSGLGCAAVAQSVEQRIRNAKVTSSIPVSGTRFHKKFIKLYKLKAA